MNEALNRVGRIELLEKQINNLNVQENQTSYWQKLSKMCENLSSDQQEYINTNDEVKKAKLQMMEAFNLFLFESFKEQFAGNNFFLKYCDEYIYKVQDALNDYKSNMSRVIEENKKLKEELKQVKKGGYCDE